LPQTIPGIATALNSSKHVIVDLPGMSGTTFIESHNREKYDNANARVKSNKVRFLLLTQE
jgi:hypothetical protein